MGVSGYEGRVLVGASGYGGRVLVGVSGYGGVWGLFAGGSIWPV